MATPAQSEGVKRQQSMRAAGQSGASVGSGASQGHAGLPSGSGSVASGPSGLLPAAASSQAEAAQISALLEAKVLKPAPSTSNSSSSSNVPQQPQTSPESLLRELRMIHSDFTKQSSTILSDIRHLQMAAEVADIKLQDKLTRQGITLRTIGGIVDGMSVQFDAAVTGGLQVGEKLAQAEAERQRVHYAEDLVEYINFFASTPREMVSLAQNLEGEDLLTLLPLKLRNQGWTHIALAMFNLRRIVYDIGAADMHQATAMALALSESIEKDLLHLFEALALQLLETPDDREVIASTREVVVALHFFNEGMALQKRYIFSIAQSRRPKERQQRRDGLTKKLLQGVSSLGDKLRGKGKSSSKQNLTEYADEDGNNDNDRDTVSVATKPQASASKGRESLRGEGSPSSDDLSGLLASLQTLINEQLLVIRSVFPRATAEKVTKALITRIFNDPIFNIQNAIDTLMSNAGGSSSPSMYLDVLQIVREKLSAFIVVILENCKVQDREMSNLAVEDALGAREAPSSDNDSAGAAPTASRSSPYANLVREFVVAVVGGGSAARPNAAISTGTSSSASETGIAVPSAFIDDVKQFLSEQTGLLLSNYMKDYFQKELGYLWSQYNDTFRASVDDANLIVKVKQNTISDPNAGSRFKRGSQVDNMIYKLRPDRFKTVAQLLHVVESGIIQRILAPSSDAALRMLNIGREDPTLPGRLSELFKTMLACLAEHVLLPIAETFQLLLAKHTNGRSFTSAPIPIDYIDVLAAIYDAFFRIKTSFDFTFAPAFASHPNDLTACREFKRSMVKRIDAAFSVSLLRWIEAVAYFCDRALNNLQSRFDFAPKFSNDKMLGIEPTSACKEVCRTLANSIALVRKHITERPENSADKTSAGKSTALRLKKIADSVWKDLGFRFVAIYLTHLRKHRVSQEGAFVLVRDLDEIYAVISTMDCIQVTDMIASIREVVYVYMAPTENIVHMITDELRHLDTLILLTLLRSRSDYSAKSAWVKELNQIYPSLTKWDNPFPWEPDANSSSNSSGGSAASHHLIARRLPRTLRKVSIEKSALLVPMTKRFGGPGGPAWSIAPNTGGSGAAGSNSSSILMGGASTGAHADSSSQSNNLYQRLKSVNAAGSDRSGDGNSSFLSQPASLLSGSDGSNVSSDNAIRPTASTGASSASTAPQPASATAPAAGNAAAAQPSKSSSGLLKMFGFG